MSYKKIIVIIITLLSSLTTHAQLKIDDFYRDEDAKNSFYDSWYKTHSVEIKCISKDQKNNVLSEITITDHLPTIVADSSAWINKSYFYDDYVKSYYAIGDQFITYNASGIPAAFIPLVSKFTISNSNTPSTSLMFGSVAPAFWLEREDGSKSLVLERVLPETVKTREEALRHVRFIEILPRQDKLNYFKMYKSKDSLALGKAPTEKGSLECAEDLTVQWSSIMEERLFGEKKTLPLIRINPIDFLYYDPSTIAKDDWFKNYMEYSFKSLQDEHEYTHSSFLSFYSSNDFCSKNKINCNLDNSYPKLRYVFDWNNDVFIGDYVVEYNDVENKIISNYTNTKIIKRLIKIIYSKSSLKNVAIQFLSLPVNSPLSPKYPGIYQPLPKFIKTYDVKLHAQKISVATAADGVDYVKPDDDSNDSYLYGDYGIVVTNPEIEINGKRYPFSFCKTLRSQNYDEKIISSVLDYKPFTGDVIYKSPHQLQMEPVTDAQVIERELCKFNPAYLMGVQF